MKRSGMRSGALFFWEMSFRHWVESYTTNWRTMQVGFYDV